ncbi:MAG: sigma-70 family RNA polymerase sigma factor [Kofleriaceae bacterium]
MESEAIFEAAIAAGAAKWPDLSIDKAAFIAAITRSLPEDTIEDLHITDLYLAQACVTDPNAIAAFERAYHDTITGSLRALRVPDHLAADLAQDVRAKLFVDGKIATFSGRAALASWLRTIVTRAAVAAMKKRSITPADDDALDALPDSNDTPQQQYFRAHYHSDFKSAFEAALASLTDQQRELLRQRFVEGVALEVIGERYNVHKTTAFRWLEEAQVALNKRTQNAFQLRTRATVSEMRSILRLVESNIELSLRRVLGK